MSTKFCCPELHIINDPVLVRSDEVNWLLRSYDRFPRNYSHRLQDSERKDVTQVDKLVELLGKTSAYKEQSESSNQSKNTNYNCGAVLRNLM